MISDFLQDQASLYAVGAMTTLQRGEFELLLETDPELQKFVAGLCEVGTALMLATQPCVGLAPSPYLKARLLDLISDRPQRPVTDALVACGPDGFVRWVNPAFTAMCGYTEEELRGKKLGPILQGVGSDRQVADRIRCAVRECRPCHETVLNYHKNGTPYWVEIEMTPFFDDSGDPILLVARERELIGRGTG